MSVLYQDSALEALDEFYELLYSHINKSSYSVSTRSKTRKVKPWMTSGILKSIRFRDKLYQKYISHKKQCLRLFIEENPSFRQKYVSYRNWLNKLIEIQRESYITHKINTANTPKQKWETINEFTQRTKNLRDKIPL